MVPAFATRGAAVAPEFFALDLLDLSLLLQDSVYNGRSWYILYLLQLVSEVTMEPGTLTGTCNTLSIVF